MIRAVTDKIGTVTDQEILFVVAEIELKTEVKCC